MGTFIPYMRIPTVVAHKARRGGPVGFSATPPVRRDHTSVSFTRRPPKTAATSSRPPRAST